MSIKELEKYKAYRCACGRVHSFSSRVVAGEDVFGQIPELCEQFSAENIYVVADKNTFVAAAEKVIAILSAAGKMVTLFKFQEDRVIPDEAAVGSVLMNMPMRCELIIGVGSGVINDVCKIVASRTEKPYFIVATAPSMDGYAAAGSSMEMNGVKTTIPSKAPNVIIGDYSVLSSAPKKMMISGLGDMLAKYVALCEWRIASVIVGEYYCEEIASLVRLALKKCVDNAQGLINGDTGAVGAVFDGLIICGAAIEYAGISRPASGAEHYFSHILDMRSLAYGTPSESHGIQCALGTLYVLKMYEVLKREKVDKSRALSFVNSYSYSRHAEFLRSYLGKAAEKLIELEEKEGKYDKDKHSERLDLIIENWDDILSVINGEMPDYNELFKLWKSVGGPVDIEEIGTPKSELKNIFSATKDIRDKYVLSFLLWDLGLFDDVLDKASEK